VALYVAADLKLQSVPVGGIGGAAIDPRRMRIYVVGNHDVTIGGQSQQYMELYAPQSRVTVWGTPGFFGSIVGKTVDFRGDANIHYDQSNQTSVSDYKIHLVK
jgi:hypothetical protein